MAAVQPLSDDEVASFLRLLEAEQMRAHVLMDIVIPIGVALAYETQFDRLLERILIDAMKLCSAEAGALYLRSDDEMLRTAIVRASSTTRTSAEQPPELPIPVIDPQSGSPNRGSIAARAALLGEVVNIPDLIDAPDTCFREAHVLARHAGCGVRSCLAVPLRCQVGKVIGVVVLANARRSNGEVCPFEPGTQKVVESLCLLASAALESYRRQQHLKDQVREMSIQIDEAKKTRQVSAIVQSDYFKNLRERAKEIRTSVTPSIPES